MKKITYSTALLSILAGIGLVGVAHADTKNSRIAFSNNYAGNSWRQAMLKSYDIVTKKAVADGIVAAADVFTTADKESADTSRPNTEPDSSGLQRDRHQRPPQTP
jgi:ribose transport system substrate-binding protein